MSIYDHYRKEERPFVDQVVQWKELVSTRFVHKLTDFLDPREQKILTSIIGHDPDICLTFFGGPQTAERKRALIYPTYFEVSEEDFQISAYRFTYPSKFMELSHRDCLGSMMGLGLKREKFGDIYNLEDTFIIIVATEVSGYLEANFHKVGRATIQLQPISFSKVHVPQVSWQMKSITASSLRLDVVLSEIYQLSRSKIAPFIEQKRVKVNWKLVDEASFQLQQGDDLSVRGLGRSKIHEIQGKTKKDKWRIEVGIRK